MSGRSCCPGIVSHYRCTSSRPLPQIFPCCNILCLKCHISNSYLVLIGASAACFHFGEGDILTSSLGAQSQRRELAKYQGPIRSGSNPPRWPFLPLPPTPRSCPLPSTAETPLSLGKCLLFPTCGFLSVYAPLLRKIHQLKHREWANEHNTDTVSQKIYEFFNSHEASFPCLQIQTPGI